MSRPVSPTPLKKALVETLKGPLPGAAAHARAWPEGLPHRDGKTHREAAVLLLLFTGPDGAMQFPLVERPQTMPTHAGQIAFPGGGQAPGETSEETALREMNEELGVSEKEIEVVGSLTPVSIPVSGFRVTPVVGWAEAEPMWRPDPREVVRMLVGDPDRIARDGPTTTFRRSYVGSEWDIPAFEVEGKLVWGATALMLAEFGEVWSRLDSAGTKRT